MTSGVNVERSEQLIDGSPPYPTYEVEIERQVYWGRNASIGEITACTSWLRTDLKAESGMTFVEIEIPNGYAVTRDAINNIYAKKIPGLKRIDFEYQTLYLFFDTVS
jgi:hypothetical protein